MSDEHDYRLTDLTPRSPERNGTGSALAAVASLTIICATIVAVTYLLTR